MFEININTSHLDVASFLTGKKNPGKLQGYSHIKNLKLLEEQIYGSTLLFF